MTRTESNGPSKSLVNHEFPGLHIKPSKSVLAILFFRTQEKVSLKARREKKYPTALTGKSYHISGTLVPSGVYSLIKGLGSLGTIRY